MRSLHAILAALGAAGALGGCVEEPASGAGPVGPGVYAALTGAELTTIGAPGPSTRSTRRGRRPIARR